MTELASNWIDYELIDAGNRDKLERWGDIILVRPDPQAIWHRHDDSRWKRYDAIYHRSSKGGGSWEFNRKLPEYWTISYRDLKFKVSPTNFKHTGLFPEQAVNWDWLTDKIRNSGRTDIRVLNLFAYTGAATMACAKGGAEEVVHVDAAKGMVNWAKENMALNSLQDHTIRFMVDDAVKFLQREQRRNRTYDIIIMDPPSYGRGPNNELWKLEDQLEGLITEAFAVLSSQPLAFLISSYTTGFSPIVLENIMKQHAGKLNTSRIYTVELGIPMSDSDMILPCGISGRIEF